MAENPEERRQPGLATATPAWCTVFLAVPSTGGYQSEMAALRRACSSFGAKTRQSVRTLSGDQLHSDDPAEVRVAIRSALTSRVEGVIIIHGPSWGCGREDTLAAELGIPRLLAYRGNDPRSTLAGPDGSDAVAQGSFDSLPELEELVYAWLDAYYTDMCAYREHRDVADELSEPFRRACIRAWGMLDEDAQTRLAQEFGLSRSQMDSLLMSQRDFSERHEGTVLRLATRLGVWDPGTHRLDPAPSATTCLSTTRRKAFEDAKRTWRWDNATAAAVLERGIQHAREDAELLAAGQPSRYSLESRFGWLQVYRELCGAQDN